MGTAHVRAYGELNDFLPAERRQVRFPYSFLGRPAIKDGIESIGIPHPEVELIVVDGASVPFEHRVEGGEHVAVYPRFRRVALHGVVRLRPPLPAVPRFLLDVHLGRLARTLRLLGFDAAYRRHADDPELARESAEQARVLLTRDLGLLKRGEVVHGSWIRATDPAEQSREVVRRYELAELARPYTRCLVCNATIVPVAKQSVIEEVPANTLERYDAFARCDGCGRVFWAGAHDVALRRLVEDALRGPLDADPD